jgi:hypothetical protein
MTRLARNAALSLTLIVTGCDLYSPESAWAAFNRSTSASATYSTAVLAAPTNLQDNNGMLTWTSTSSTFASGTRVYLSLSPGGPYWQIAQITGRNTTSYTYAPLQWTAYYVVAAYYNGNGANWTSSNSNEVNV